MILKGTLKQIIISQKQDLNREEIGLIRDKLKSIPLNSKSAIIISGIRRCGKSTLLKQLLMNYQNINYLNFEDPLLSSFEIKDYAQLLDAFEEINPNTAIYFFDEIQNINERERMIRILLDKNKQLFITGSNSALLSKELGSKLTGRHLRFELFPFSYREYLNFFKQQASSSSLSKYLLEGGFPQYLKEKNPLLLKELLLDVLNRDILVRYNIKSASRVRELLIYLISNNTTLQSYNKLAKAFNVKSVNSIKTYMNYFEDAYLIFSVPLFSYSIKKQVVNPKKIYCIDTGLASNNGVNFSENKGRLLENSILLELKRRGKETYYYRNNKECDFIIKEGTKATEAIQVCYELNEENKDREINGLIEALNDLKLETGTIITFNQKDSFTINGKKIKVLPAWDWLIKNK